MKSLQSHQQWRLFICFHVNVSVTESHPTGTSHFHRSPTEAAEIAQCLKAYTSFVEGQELEWFKAA
jgi:hypothetical protein